MLKRIVASILLVGVLAWFFHPFLLERAAYFLIVQDELKKADAIVVISGDVSGERVAQAAELYKRGYAKYLLMSGGLAMWHQTHADNMRGQARLLGVPAKAILIEDRSRSTYENAKFCLPILKARKVRSIILVSSPFHMRRARRVFKSFLEPAGIEVRAYPAQKSDFKLSEWWTRHEDTQKIVNEYMGIIFYLIKGY